MSGPWVIITAVCCDRGGGRRDIQ